MPEDNLPKTDKSADSPNPGTPSTPTPLPNDQDTPPTDENAVSETVPTDEPTTTGVDAPSPSGLPVSATPEEGEQSPPRPLEPVAEDPATTEASEAIAPATEQPSPVVEDSSSEIEDSSEAEQATEAQETMAIADQQTPDEKAAPTAEQASETANPTAAESDSDDDTEEEDNAEENEEEPTPDLSELNRQELLDALRQHLKDGPRRATLRALREAFEQLVSTERSEALARFVADGSDPNDFVYRPDEVTTAFQQAYQEHQRAQRSQRVEQEAQRQHNLDKKRELLEQLRQLVEAEETQESITALRVLQEQWRAAGSVPGPAARDLYATYHALLDRYYDQRSIYFELKELDRRKNLEAKKEVITRARQLLEMPSLNEAIRTLNELHEEYKTIGPVPRELSEPLWQEFKAISDQVHDRRRAHQEQVRKELEANLVVKQELVRQVTEFTTFDSDRIDDWNARTQEIQALRDAWKNTGGVPRQSAQEVSHQFWAAFKQFFNHKSQFFKTLEKEREGNLTEKLALCERAEALQESSDWRATADELKKLQQAWKASGPVPIKKRNEVYKRFKKAVDTFFNRRRAHHAQQDNEFEENLRQKQALCAELEALAESKDATLPTLQTMQSRWNEIGFVPRANISQIQERWHKAVEAGVDASTQIDEGEKAKTKLLLQMAGLKGAPRGGHSPLQRKENHLRHKINQLEDEISLWQNNLEFFANSKSADKFRREFDQKIAAAQQQVKQLKDQLRIIRSVEH